MPGKNKVLRWVRMFIGAYDMSGDARTFGELRNGIGEVDMLAWSDAVHWFLPDGHRVKGVDKWQAFLNDAAAGAWTLLKQAAATQRVLTIAFGSGAEPALGDATYILAGTQFTDLNTLDAMAPTLNVSLDEDAGQYSAQAENPLGYVLQAAVSLSATTTGTGFDNGALTSNGGHANLHVLVSSGGTWSLKVQHSVDNVTFADLITFTSTGAAIGAEHKTASGTVNRYTRVLLTRTSGSLTVMISFARN
jgi:hypothetical protein